MRSNVSSPSIFVTIVLGAWLSGPVVAQPSSASGKVIDARDGTPLIGVHIISFSNWRTGTTTNAEGIFTIDMGQFGSADTLIVQYVGYGEKLVTLSQLQKNATVKLEPKTQSMEQVTINAERIIAEEFVVKKISKLDIYKNPSAKADPLLAVNAMPSSTTVDETASVSFRGSSPAETGVFFNHVPTYDAVRFAQLTGIGTFSFFNTEMIGSLYVFPGNPPLEYGNTSSGLIAIETSNTIVEKNRTSLSLSLANLGVNHQQRINDKQSIMVYGNYQPSGPLRALNRVSLERIKRFETRETGVHYINQLAPGLSLKSFHYVLSERYTFDFRAPTFSGDFLQKKKRTFHVVNLMKRTKKGAIGINGGFNASQTELGYSRFTYRIGNTDSYGSVTYTVAKKRAGWKAGVAYDDRLQKFSGLVPEFQYAVGETAPAMNVASVTGRKILDAFASYKYTPSKLLAFGWALRKNIPLAGQSHTLSHQSSVSIQVNKKNRFTVGSGTFHQLALLQGEGVSKIKSQQVAVDHSLSAGRLSAANAVFFKKIEKNETAARVLGIESYWSYKLAEKWLADISYTGIEATEKENGNTKKAIYDLDFFIRGGAQWSNRGWTVGCRYIFRQGTWFYPVVGSTYNNRFDVFEPLTSPLQSRQPAYNLIDLSFSKLLPLPKDDGLVLFASVSNMADFKNVRDRAYSADYSSFENELFNRRTIYAGLMWVIQ
ncbi:MAG: TonB-dependent receptor [Imperialibacter sp.]|uniref:TonB-dependent receptor n=1 Tax=Imperialibacter sp. TaxID=2038411 RepID=UPI0032ECFFFE